MSLKVLIHKLQICRSRGALPTCRVASRHVSSVGKNSPPDSLELHRLYQEQMVELKTEREQLFGFSENDHTAWTNATNHKHEPSFLESIDTVRRTASHDHELSPAERTTNSQHPATGLKGPSEFTSIFSARELSHVTDDGKSVNMVNIAHKEASQRAAVAQSRVVFPPEVSKGFRTQGNANQMVELTGPKGPIFECAKVAGIMAAKKTSDLIPLCHPLPLDYVNIKIDMVDTSVAVITCECRVTHKTGVEMEALMGASIAALTIYDMTKALSHRIRIEDTILLSKTGGKNQPAEIDQIYE